MAARSIADLSLSFGLVSIPVKLYPATQARDGISFNLLHKTCGSRLKQQYICIKEQVLVERSEMVKGYEFAKDQYVVFSPDELKALEEKGTHTVDIVAFIDENAIDPIYYDKAYYLAPDKRGDKPYTLLYEGMRQSNRVALARWAWRGKAYTVQVRPSPEGGLVLQQLLYAKEVRSFKDLGVSLTDVKKPELDLAKQLIEQIAQDKFDPDEYEDEVTKRIEAAVDAKVEGKEITVSEEPEAAGAQVIDLMEALRQSLAGKAAPAAKARTATKPREEVEEEQEQKAAPRPRKGAKRVAATEEAAPARKTRAKK